MKLLSAYLPPPLSPPSQSNSLRPYLDAVRTTVDASLCLRNFPSQVVERHNKPEVEVRTSKELLLNPLEICRTEQVSSLSIAHLLCIFANATLAHRCADEYLQERCLIEASVNSVRVSLKIKQADEIENILCKKFMAFLMQRSEKFIVMRRKAIEGYDLSFLITHSQLDKMWRKKLIDFLIEFMEQIDKEISGMKIAISARARCVAQEYMKQFKT